VKIRNIIWDWNGTLVNDGWLFVELINRVLKKRGLKQLTIQDYQKSFCFPLEKYYQKIGFDFNLEPYEVPSMEFVHLYDKNKYRPDLYDGAENLLKTICNSGAKNYLLSAQNEESLIDLVQFYKVDRFFEDIRGTSNFHARGKDVVAKDILKKISPKNNALFIGDTNMDMDIAELNGFNSIGLTFGHQAKGRFKKDQAFALIDEFSSLASWLNSKLKDSL